MYQILARKYRPQSFDQVLGQTAIVTTLKNAIAQKRLHQAYLFCGARGVGKTSLARIFAKSVNCEQGPTLTPCQVCAACLDITASRAIDVLEIDGASNTGVDNIRELREQAKYLPTHGKYKIYIIDEVHMLSQSAFNALLKILEEPPPHLIFIFATTEPHKIPITILSRCQKFDYKRLSQPQLIAHFSDILKKEQIAIPDASLLLIARCADGSVRDGLSLLDQVISFCGANANPEAVRDMLGLADRLLLVEILQALLKQDVPDVLAKAQEVIAKGLDFKIFCENLLELVRDLLVLGENGGDYVDLPAEELTSLKALAPSLDSHGYLMLFQILARGTEQMARSEFPRLIFETTLIKMVRARDYMPLTEVLKQFDAAGGRPAEGVLTKPNASSRQTAVDGRQSTVERKQSTVDSRQSTADGQPLTQPVSSQQWRAFVEHVLGAKPQIGSILEHAHPLKIAEHEVCLGFEDKSIYADMLKDRLASVELLAKEYFKAETKIKITALQGKAATPTVYEVKKQDEQKKDQEAQSKALKNPMVQKMQEILGARVKEVKRIE